MVVMISVSSENFLKEGFVKIEGSLDVGLCQKLMEDFKKLRPIDADLQIPDTTKFTQKTGWKPEISFDTTMIDLLNYWRNRIENGTKFLVR